MSPENRKSASQSRSRSSVRPWSRSAASSASPKRKCGSASSNRPVPASTPYRRPWGSRRAKVSNTQSRSAVPSARAAATMVSSYRSVSRAGPVDMAPEPRRGRAGPPPGRVSYSRAVAGPLAPTVTPETTDEEHGDLDRPWVTIVWNDPVNLMNYVTFVLQELFGYDEPKATTLMLQVHHEGKPIVSSGPRERMEHDTSRLHAYGLWASYQRDA